MALSLGGKLGKNKGGKSTPPPPSRPAQTTKITKSEKGFVEKIKNYRSSTGKYAIIIGDEGAILIYLVGKQVKSRNFIAHASADNIKEFEAILAKDKKAPLYLVIDSMDQSFLQQSLPPISSLGVKKLIRRRLDRDLGTNVIKGYVLLERDATGRRDWNFLMVSLENSPHLNLWFEFVERIDNRLKGIYLLSVEAENIVKSLDRAMSGEKKPAKGNAGSRWKFFITHNKVGGFRQVILRDGRIIFTRLTQPVGEVTPEVIAGNIEQEMASTIEYMKRLAFNPQQGLDVYIVASAEINNSLDMSRISANRVNKFTPHDVAELLGISGAAQTSDQFGDVILTAFIACTNTHRLVLSLPKARKVNQIYSIVQYERALAGIALLGMIAYSGLLGIGILQKYSEIEELTQKKIVQQRRFEDLNTEIKKSELDIKAIDDTVTLYNKIGAEAHSPIAILARLRPAIIDSVTIREVSWQYGASGTTPAAAGAPQDKSESLAVVLRFPEISNTEDAFNVIAKKVMTDVRAAFPEYKVVYSKLPDAFTKKAEGGEISFDDTKKEVKVDKVNLEATLTLSGNPMAGGAASGSPGVEGIPGMPEVMRLPPGMTPEQFKKLQGGGQP